MNIDLTPRAKAPTFWGYCRYCGHTLLREDVFCPSCGRQRDWSEIIK